MPNPPTIKQLDADNRDLRVRLEKAEATLSEILSGEADALFVTGVGGAQLFALKGADQSYRKLIENMSEGALTLTPEGLVLYANRRFAEMLRTPLEKVIGSELRNWIVPEHRQVLPALLRKDAVDNRREELALVAADGTLVPVYLSVSHLDLDETNSVCMVVTDLTEQKRNEAILAAEKLERAILEQAADAIVICDETGRIMRASKQAHTFCSKSPLGQLFEQAFPLRQVDGTVFSAVGAIETNLGQLAEARLECNGQGVDFLVSVGHLKGARGQLLGSVVTLTDITERKQAEEHLKLFRTLIDNSSDAIEVLDPATLRILDVNETQCRELGYSREELLSMKVADIDLALNADMLKVIEEQIRKSGAARFESTHRRKDGTTFPVEVSAKIIELDRPYALNIVRDITERKQAELALVWRTAFFEALVKTSVDGILVVDSQGKKILQNQRLIDLWKIPEEITNNPDDKQQVQFVANQTVDAKQFGDKVRYLYEHPEEISQDEVTLKDGSFFERYSAPVLDGDGHSYGRIWTFHDNTKRKQEELKLLESERRFSDLLKNVELISMMLDREARITYCNDYLLHLTGWQYEEVIGRSWWELFLPPELHDLKGDFFAALLDNQPEALHHENDIVTRSGERRLIRWNNTVLRSGTGEVIGMASIGEDITERMQAEARVAYLNRVYAVLSGINTLIVRVKDRNELFRKACNIAVETGGFRMAMLLIVDTSTEQIVSLASAGMDDELLSATKGILSTREGVQSSIVAQSIREKKEVVSNDVLNDSRILFRKKYEDSGVRSLIALPLIVSGQATGVITLYAREIGFFQDDEIKLLTELAGDVAFAIDHIDKHERLDYLAYYDVLTGLANRTLFLERLAQYMHSAASGGHKLALGLIDLERFKNINDSLSRASGDSLLKQVAEWLVLKAGDAKLLARIDADHFAIVLPEVRSEGNLANLIDNLMVAFLEHPFNLNGAVFRIGVKVGVALFPDDGDAADILFKNAEAALKKAKASGDRFLFYTQKMTAAVAGKLALENQLRRAIDNEEFVLYYQPKVNLKSGKVTSAEALIRWNNPKTGLVPPGEFIPILEETGLILEVGRWALRKAIEDSLRWRVAGLPAMRIAVNASPLQLRNINFLGELEQAIAIDAHAAAALELEITESVFMYDLERTIVSLNAIRAMGITIAVDDFGTGFSSLSYLAKLPVDTLKIDRAFVTEMTAGSEGLALVSTIVHLAHSLNLKVVAEGVETTEQSHLLSLLQCEEMQGFLFSKPVPGEIFESRFLVPQAEGDISR